VRVPRPPQWRRARGLRASRDHAQDDHLFAVVDADNLYLGSVARHQLRQVVSSVQAQPGAPMDVLTVCNLVRALATLEGGG
jgi:hypothetical protein